MGATPEALEPYKPGVWDPDQDPVELHYLPDDFSQARDLAAKNPDKVKGWPLFWQEAEKYHLTLLSALTSFFGIVPPLPEVPNSSSAATSRTYSGMIPDRRRLLLDQRRPVIPEGGAEGVIVAEADHLGGFSLFVDKGKLTHTYS